MSFFEIFQPGLKYLREEKDRHRMLVSKPTHGGGAPLGIDLDAGVAKIKLTRPAPPAEPAQEPAEAAAPGPVEPTELTDHDEDPPAR